MRNIGREEIRCYGVYKGGMGGDRVGGEVFRERGRRMGKGCGEIGRFVRGEGFMLLGGLGEGGDVVLGGIEEGYKEDVV